ncbi:MAG: hypothetical protein ACYSUM_24320, partial [Planctomycetota bacterium]
DWREVVGQYSEPSTADWIRIMHGVLRRKSRYEAAGEVVTPVTVQDLLDEVHRFQQARNRLPIPHGGTYV